MRHPTGEGGGLLDAFNKALAEVMADGTYEKLSKKYFDQDIRCTD